jgi:hypothetical protein
MCLILRSLLRARRVEHIVAGILLVGLVNAFLAAHQIPTIGRVTADYPSAVFADFSPVMVSMIVLAATRSGMCIWDGRAGLRLPAFLFCLYLALSILAVLALGSAAGRVRGVCACCGCGFLLSLKLDYLALSMVMFCGGAIAINLVTAGAVGGFALDLLPGPQGGGSVLPAVGLLVCSAGLAALVKRPA